MDTPEGREEIDRETFEEIARLGASTVEVKGIDGKGECPAIRFGERGSAAPGDRDQKVPGEVREAVLLRDGACAICGGHEDLTAHHLDSHADGGTSDMTRLLTMCLSCQGSVHGGELVLAIENDGKISARDLEGVVVTKPKSSAEVLAASDDGSPLEIVECRGSPPPMITPEGDEAFTLDSLPAEITSAEWLSLERSLEWSARERVFLLHPKARIPLGSSQEETSAPSGCGACPVSFEDFSGQRRAVENLLLAARAAKGRDEPLAHVVLHGPPGLGKTTLARLLARECGSRVEETVGGNIAGPGQLLSLLARLKPQGFFIIDEVHALERDTEEFLYSALDDRVVSAILRQGARSRAIRVRLAPFTLVGTTTRLGALSGPFRSRFRIRERLEHYDEESLAEVVERRAQRIGGAVSAEAAREVARRSRGTPREAIRLLERARDVSQLSDSSSIESAHVGEAAERAGIDRFGLDEVDRRAVKLLLGLGRPLGVESLAARIGIDRATFHDAHEPWLERRGLIERTERGRVATEEARALYGVERIPISNFRILAP
jgi:holliday junction DNA helicase RuvB